MENIYTTVKPFYLLAKVMGTFPMTFEGQATRGVLKTKWHDVLLSIIAVLILIAFIVTKYNMETVIKVESSMLVRAWDLYFLFGFHLLIVQLCLQLCKRNQICEFMRLLHKFDAEASNSKLT